MATDVTRIVIGSKAEPVRFSYAHVFTPRENGQGGKPKYSVTLLIPKTYKRMLKQIQTSIEAAAERGRVEKWGGKLPRFKHEVLRDGDEEYPDKPEYEGMMFIAAKSDRRPEIVDVNRDEIMSDDEFYSGCWGRASVNFYPYTVETNKGVACGLGNLQKTKDDTPFGGGGRSAAMDFGDDDEDNDLD